MTEKTAVKTAVTNKTVIHPIIVSKPVKIRRELSCKSIANDMKSRIMGKLLGFEDLFDPKTKTFLTEDDLRAKGAVFVGVDYDKVLSFASGDANKKSRTTGEPTPYIRKTKKVLILANIYWESFVNKRGHGEFIAQEYKSNGIENSDDCRAIGEKTNKAKIVKYYICGIEYRIVEKSKYFDADGNEYPDTKALFAEYLKGSSKKSRQREADKHGIKLEFDPQFRTYAIENCSEVRAFGFEFVPNDDR